MARMAAGLLRACARRADSVGHLVEFGFAVFDFGLDAFLLSLGNGVSRAQRAGEALDVLFDLCRQIVHLGALGVEPRAAGHGGGQPGVLGLHEDELGFEVVEGGVLGEGGESPERHAALDAIFEFGVLLLQLAALRGDVDEFLDGAIELGLGEIHGEADVFQAAADAVEELEIVENGVGGGGGEFGRLRGGDDFAHAAFVGAIDPDVRLAARPTSLRERSRSAKAICFGGTPSWRATSSRISRLRMLMTRVWTSSCSASEFIFNGTSE